MKSVTLAIAALSILQVTVAQPHRRRHVHERAHRVVKKDVVTIIDTVYAEATDVPEVIVYVDQNGNPLSTITEGAHANPSASAWSTAFGATPTPSPATPSPSTSAAAAPVADSSPAPAAAAPVAVSSPAPVQAASSSTPAAIVIPENQAASPVASTPAAQTQAAAPATSSTASTSTSSDKSGHGISYSPYNADQTCKTQDQVNSDFNAIGDGYAMVRIYGTDCNQVATVLAAAKAHGMKVFAGVYALGSLASEIAIIAKAANGDWSSFDTISIGNELVNSGTASATSVVAAIGTARGLLKATGYTGKVVTVDTLVAARANPSLCDASDYCAVNCHPFFDGNYAAADSGKFLTEQVPTLQAVLSNKSQQVVITETGWPWKGQSNGAAVPSLSNQAAALGSIKTAYSSNPGSVILFTAFNDLWKSNTAAQFQAEQYWGMGGSNPPSG